VIPSIQGSIWSRSYGRHIWILDFGSTYHMRFTLDGMTDLVPFKSPITCGNREIIFIVSKKVHFGVKLFLNMGQSFMSLWRMFCMSQDFS
jgi:hypothetical protein